MSVNVIDFRPATPADRAFLYRVYASTRREELAITGWSDSQLDDFLKMQFEWQAAQYLNNYPDASFDLILVDGNPAGRFYVDRTQNDIRIIDIALLPEFRGRGTGGRIIGALIREADAEGRGISLHVEANNPARRLYERLGFKITALRGIFYHLARTPGGNQ